LPIRTWRLLTSCIIFAHLFLSRNIWRTLLLLNCCCGCHVARISRGGRRLFSRHRMSERSWAKAKRKQVKYLLDIILVKHERERTSL
jgi:hypothetical protein